MTAAEILLTKDNVLDHILKAAQVLEAQSVPPPSFIRIPDWMARAISHESPGEFLQRNVERINELKALNWNEKTILKRIKKENRARKDEVGFALNGKVGHLENFKLYVSNKMR